MIRYVYNYFISLYNKKVTFFKNIKFNINIYAFILNDL